MNDLELIELVAETDRYRPATPLPELFGEPIGTLHDIERRAQMDSIEVTETETKPGGGDPRRGPRGVWMAAAVFLAVLTVVGAVIAFVSSDEGDVATDPPPTTAVPTTTPPTTEAAGLSEEEALAVAGAYFAAFEGGDLEAIMDLLAADVEFGSRDFDYDSRTDFELGHAWNIAQQTTLVDVDCQVAGGPTADESFSYVLCTFGELDYVAGAVGAPPVGLQVFVWVDPGGRITRFERSLSGLNDYNTVGAPFDLWMQANYPDAQDEAGCCWGQTVEESIARGEAVVLYADLWAAYLEENGCVWDEPCEP